MCGKFIQNWIAGAYAVIPCGEDRLQYTSFMRLPKTTVYILKSKPEPGRYYTGVTSDWCARLQAHNDGRCTHTARYRPWEIDVVIQFNDERRALAFERYLKSGSGHAFAKRHLR